MNEASFRQRVVGNICQYDFLLYWVLVIEIVLLLFATLSALYADLDDATRTILVIDFLMVGFITATTLGLIYLCGRQR